jgi:hypothetical protein
MRRYFIGFSKGFVRFWNNRKFLHSSFWHFTRRRTGKGVPDTHLYFRQFSHAGQFA